MVSTSIYECCENEYSLCHCQGGDELYEKKPLLLLQKKNGLDLSATYGNDIHCAELVSTIAADLRKVTADALQHSRYVPILIDGDFGK